MTIKGYCQRSISTDDENEWNENDRKSLFEDSRIQKYKNFECKTKTNFHLKLTQSIIQILHCLPVSIAWLE